MPQPTTSPSRRLASALCLLLSLPFAAAAAPPQAKDAERERALRLWEAQNFVEAAPLLEKLAAASPEDVAVLSRLGFALYALSSQVKDPAAREAARERARAVLLRSKEAGDNSNITRLTLDALASGDPTANPFTAIKEAERAMREGEEAFVRGDLDGALAAYRRALELDPKLYEAALYAGDMYFKKGHTTDDPRARGEMMSRAAEWFARAVAIDPDRETAHRYWGDALMMGQNRKEESRARFADAVVAEPYSRHAWAGLIQWGGQYGVRPAHPPITPPKSAAEAGADPVWAPYFAAREEWRTRRFAEAFPGARGYRHSLAEEAAALRAASAAASKLAWSGKALTPALEALVELDKAGLLEAFVLLARADEGIAQDYAEYRRANRDKLRRYLLEYVASGKY
ncbi:MAG TPA: tetratricopeptide repeat protein [Pyrinomonadaceae bacterium]|jgi:tetratricopeptide (TPR) repeat protein